MTRRLALVACAALAACGLPPVQVAHVTAMSLAEANHVAALVCAEVAVTQASTDPAKGEATLGKCKAAHAKAHSALLVAGAAIDAWRAGAAGKPGCAVLDAQVAVLELASLVRSGGGKLSEAVDSAIAFAGNAVTAQLGGCNR